MKYKFPKMILDWSITSEGTTYSGCKFCGIVVLNDEGLGDLIAVSSDGRFRIDVVYTGSSGWATGWAVERALAVVRTMGEMDGPRIDVDRAQEEADAHESDNWRWTLTDDGEMIASGSGDTRMEAVKIAAAFSAGMAHEGESTVKPWYRKLGTFNDGFG